MFFTYMMKFNHDPLMIAHQTGVHLLILIVYFGCYLRTEKNIPETD
jgi:hypothetical protein